MAVFTYTLSLVFIKWSILAWYWRLFHIQSYMKPLIWILFAVVCIWGVAKVRSMPACVWTGWQFTSS